MAASRRLDGRQWLLFNHHRTAYAGMAHFGCRDLGRALGVIEELIAEHSANPRVVRVRPQSPRTSGGSPFLTGLPPGSCRCEIDADVPSLSQ